MKRIRIWFVVALKIAVMYLLMANAVYLVSETVCYLIENGEPHTWEEISYIAIRLTSAFISLSAFKQVWDLRESMRVHRFIEGGK